jgi:hypothetical protein
MFCSKGTVFRLYIYIYVHTHTHIKITKKRLGCRWFIYEKDLIYTINQFTLKGNCGVYRCHFSFVDFVVSG